MAIDFPTAPSVGQTLTAAGTTYKWDGTAWNIVPPMQSTAVSDLPPANPYVGQFWWRGSNGQLYIYVDDGNSLQWVQVVGGNSTAGNDAGKIDWFAMATPPAGWLKCNGALVNRVLYKALFNAIGTVWGAGDGSTTFKLPEVRGEFARAWDDGRGVDTGRVFGSAQLDAIENIVGQIGDFGGMANRAWPLGFIASGAFSNQDASGRDIGNLSAGQGAQVNHTTVSNFDASRVVKTSTETRARNIAFLCCIKY